MFVVGLTGITGTGKSTCAEYLKSRGCYVISADLLAHETYLPNTDCFKKIVENFGSAMVTPDGHIDRKKLGQMVFANSVKMKELTDIVWPSTKILLQECLQRLKQCESTSYKQIVILEAAVLIEAGWVSLVDAVMYLFVNDRRILFNRLKERYTALSDESIEARFTSQQSKESSTNFLIEAQIPFEVVETTKPLDKTFEEITAKLSSLCGVNL